MRKILISTLILVISGLFSITSSIASSSKFELGASSPRIPINFDISIDTGPEVLFSSTSAFALIEQSVQLGNSVNTLYGADIAPISLNILTPKVCKLFSESPLVDVNGEESGQLGQEIFLLKPGKCSLQVISTEIGFPSFSWGGLVYTLAPSISQVYDFRILNDRKSSKNIFCIKNGKIKGINGMAPKCSRGFKKII